MNNANWLWVLNPIVLLVLAIVGATWKLGSWKGSVDKALGALHKAIDRLEKKFDRFEKKIDALPTQAFASGSPLRLTEFGEKLSREIKAKEWAAALAPALIKKCEDKVPYEVQQICIEYAKTELQPTTDEDTALKVCAYENGIEVEIVRKVSGIELRDEVLTKRKA